MPRAVMRPPKIEYQIISKFGTGTGNNPNNAVCIVHALEPP